MASNDDRGTDGTIMACPVVYSLETADGPRVAFHGLAWKAEDTIAASGYFRIAMPPEVAANFGRRLVEESARGASFPAPDQK